MKHPGIVALLAAGLLLPATVPAEAPDVIVTEPSFSFGKIPESSTLTRTFWIKSNVEKPVTITKFVPGCGCTKSTLVDSLVQPNDSVRLDITFASGRFRGAVTKKPYFLTDGSSDRHQITISGDVVNDTTLWSPVRFRPFRLDVSQFTTKARTKAKFFLENLSEEELGLTVIPDAGRNFSVDLPGKIKPGERIEGMVTVHDEAIESSFEESFTLELSNGMRLSLPVIRMYNVPGAAIGQR